jgi:hypothetical protein
MTSKAPPRVKENSRVQDALSLHYRRKERVSLGISFSYCLYGDLKYAMKNKLLKKKIIGN